MKRRYNMSRSDNFPVCATVEIFCLKDNGRQFVYTGFPVQSAIVSKISGSDKAEIVPDMSFGEPDGFYILFSKVEPNTSIKFLYQAQ